MSARFSSAFRRSVRGWAIRRTNLSEPARTLQIVVVVVITVTQAMFNHLGIRVTTWLTDFSGYLILVVASALTIALLWYAPSHDFSRLVTWTNYSGLPKASPVWPSTGNVPWLFALGLMLPMYTITGFDASAHASEETVGAAHHVPRAIVRSVLVSGIFGWVMLAAVVVAIPDMNEAAAQGENAFYWIMDRVLPGWLGLVLCVGIVVAQYICGLAIVTSASRMTYAFARDGGLPWSRVSAAGEPPFRSPAVAIWAVAALAIGFHDLYAGLHDDRHRLRDFSLSFVRRAHAVGPDRLRPQLDGDGTVEPGPLVPRAGGRLSSGGAPFCSSSACSRRTTRRCGSCWVRGRSRRSIWFGYMRHHFEGPPNAAVSCGIRRANRLADSTAGSRNSPRPDMRRESLMSTVRLVGLDFGTTTSGCVIASANLTHNAVSGRQRIDRRFARTSAPISSSRRSMSRGSTRPGCSNMSTSGWRQAISDRKRSSAAAPC